MLRSILQNKAPLTQKNKSSLAEEIQLEKQHYLTNRRY